MVINPELPTFEITPAIAVEADDTQEFHNITNGFTHLVQSSLEHTFGEHEDTQRHAAALVTHAIAQFEGTQDTLVDDPDHQSLLNTYEMRSAHITEVCETLLKLMGNVLVARGFEDINDSSTWQSLYAPAIEQEAPSGSLQAAA